MRLFTLGTRIENYNKKANEIVEEKKSVSKQSDSNSADRNAIKKLLECSLKDTDDSNSVLRVDNALESDHALISESLNENEGARLDTLDDVESMMNALQSNLEKLDRIRSSSDLVIDNTGKENTQNRIEALKTIIELLDGETDTSSNTDNSSVLLQEGSNEFKDNLKVNNVESIKHDYVLGILASNVNFSNEYKSILKERYYSAEKNSKTVFDISIQKKVLSIVDGNWSGCPHYYPLMKGERKRGVYYNAHADEVDDKYRGKGSTFFHEIGHMIDHSYGDNKYLSSSDSFLTALNDDLSMIKNKLDTDAKWNQKFYDMLYGDNSTHSISDILEGLTDGAICGRFGHIGGDFNYWKRDKYRICNESFAHFFEASMGGGTKLRRIKICFPNAYREFNKMLESIINNYSDDVIRIRERSFDYVR